MARAFLCGIKGNLRYTICLLGTEAPIEELNDDQRRLRNAALAMKCKGKGPFEIPERPLWANGAIVYLHPKNEEEILLAIADREPREKILKSRHILVSETLYDPLMNVLSAQPQCNDKDGVQLRRAGEISSRIEIKLKTYPVDELRRLCNDEKIGGCPFAINSQPVRTTEISNGIPVNKPRSPQSMKNQRQ